MQDKSAQSKASLDCKDTMQEYDPHARSQGARSQASVIISHDPPLSRGAPLQRLRRDNQLSSALLECEQVIYRSVTSSSALVGSVRGNQKADGQVQPQEAGPLLKPSFLVEDVRIATVSSRSFLVAPILTATPTNCMISSEPSPTMWTPSTFSVGRRVTSL